MHSKEEEEGNDSYKNKEIKTLQFLNPVHKQLIQTERYNQSISSYFLVLLSVYI